MVFIKTSFFGLPQRNECVRDVRFQVVLEMKIETANIQAGDWGKINVLCACEFVCVCALQNGSWWFFFPKQVANGSIHKCYARFRQFTRNCNFQDKARAIMLKIIFENSWRKPTPKEHYVWSFAHIAHVRIYDVAVLQLGWEKGRVRKKLGTI